MEWKLPCSLDFHPARHGFHFANAFVNHVSPGITTYGLCGGMSLAASRYWIHKLPIPTHVPADFPDGNPAGVPPPGSPLHDHIYWCQIASYGPLGLLSAGSWVTAPHVTWDMQFQWSLDELAGVRRYIDGGLPVVVGLRRREGGPMGHQVLAYGYDQREPRIYVYDPDYPDQEKSLHLNQETRRINYDGEVSPEWSSLFVTGCPMEGDRPSYVDLGLQGGLSIGAPDSISPGGQVTLTASVRNFGFRDAHLRQLWVYVRGPRGENLDPLLGGGDGDAAPLGPGTERRVERTCTSFASTPGTYTIGLAYLSEQEQWIKLPAVAGGTRNEVTLRVADPGRRPVVPWASLGGVLTSPPAVAANADGRLEVFSRGTDNRIWHLVQQSVERRTEFSSWEVLPGDQGFAGPSAVALNHWQKLELFARGRDGALWHRWQNEPNARSSSQWSPWNHRGGQLAGDPSVVANHDGRLEVFAVHADGRVYHLWQRWFDAFGAPWSGWEAIGYRRFGGRVAPARDGTGRLWALARSRDDDSIWRSHQVSPGGPWSEWERTNGSGSEPMLGMNGDGRLEAFVRDTDGRVWHQWQAQPGSGFSDWVPLHPTAPRVPILDQGMRPTAVNLAGGALSLVMTEGNGDAYQISRIEQAPYWTAFVLRGNELFSEIGAATGGGSTGLFALGPQRDLRFLVVT